MPTRIRKNPGLRRKLRSIDRAVPPSLGVGGGKLLAAVRQLTPVKTGRMRRGWRLVKVRAHLIRITNPVTNRGFPYPTLVERRRRIIRRALARVRMIQETGRELKRRVRIASRAT